MPAITVQSTRLSCVFPNKKPTAHGKGNLPVGFDCLSAWGYPDWETIAAPGGGPGGQLVDDAAASLTFCAACFMLFLFI